MLNLVFSIYSFSERRNVRVKYPFSNNIVLLVLYAPSGSFKLIFSFFYSMPPTPASAQCLSPDQDVFAVASHSFGNDGSSTHRIRLFDVNSSQIKLTLMDNLVHKKKGGDIASSKRESGVGPILLTYDRSGRFLVSADKGSTTFTVWDVTRGVVLHKIDLPEGCVVLDVSSSHCDVSSDTDLETSIFALMAVTQNSSGESSRKLIAQQYDVSKGKGKILKKIKTGTDLSADDDDGRLAVSPDQSMLAVGTVFGGVRILDASTGQRIRKYKKHLIGRKGLSLLSFSADSRLLMCGLVTGDAVHVLECKGGHENGNGSSSSGVRTLAIDSPPLYANTTILTKEASTSLIVAVTCSSGSVMIFEFESYINGVISTASDNDISASTSASCYSKDEKVDAMMSSFSTTSDKLLIGRKLSSVDLVFESVSYIQKNERSATLMKEIKVGVEPLKEENDTVSRSTNSSRKRGVDVLGPGEVGIDTAVKDSSIFVEKIKKFRPDDNQSDGVVDDSDGQIDNDGLSIADRIRALNASAEDSDISLPLVTRGARKIPTTQGLTAVLKQGLASSDTNQLETAFQCTDKSVIETTVMKLNGSEVIDLLGEVIQRISAKPMRTALLAVWLRTILVKHSGLLMNDVELAKKLAPLNNLLKERVGTQAGFLKLQGRLNLLASRK